MEEGFQDWACHGKPILIIFWLKDLAGAFLDNPRKPLVQRTLRSQPLKRLLYLNRLILQTVNLETLVIETIDRVFVAPMIVTLRQEFFELRQLRLQILEQGLNFGPFIR